MNILRGLNTVPDIDWRCVYYVFCRNLKVFGKTWKANLTLNFLEPLFYLCSMGFGLGTYVTEVEGLAYIAFFAPGLIASSAMFATTYEMTYDCFTRMSFEKIFHGMVATPISMDDVVMGEIFYGTFKGLLYGVVFLIVVALFGIVKSPWALLVPIPLILMAIVFSSLSLIWTSLAPNYDSFSYFFTLVISPMFLFSGIFFPVDILPWGVQILTRLTPLYHAVEIIRRLVLGQVSTSLLGHFLWLAVFILITIRFPLVMVKNRLVQ